MYSWLTEQEQTGTRTFNSSKKNESWTANGTRDLDVTKMYLTTENDQDVSNNREQRAYIDEKIT